MTSLLISPFLQLAPAVVKIDRNPSVYWVPFVNPLIWIVSEEPLPASGVVPGFVAGVGVTLTISNLSMSPFVTSTLDPAMSIVLVVDDAVATVGFSGSKASTHSSDQVYIILKLLVILFIHILFVNKNNFLKYFEPVLFLGW